jgi:hypothetical protein
LLAVTLVGIAFLVSAGGRGGVASPAALGLRRPLRSPIGLAAAAYLGYIVMALAYSTVIHPHQEDVTRDLGFGHGAFGAVAAGVLIVIAAPISEELFFRGFIFGGLRHRLSFPAAGLISAVIRALHSQAREASGSSPARIPRVRCRGSTRRPARSTRRWPSTPSTTRCVRAFDLVMPGSGATPPLSPGG